MSLTATPRPPAAGIADDYPKTETRRRSGLEIREAKPESNSPGTLVGYAALFDVQSVLIADMFFEKIAPGAFGESLKSSDVRALADHETKARAVIGRRSAGTLRLVEDSIGLRFEIDLPDTTVGRDLAVSVGLGNVDGMSFGFEARRDEWDDTGKTPIRTLLEVELVEISVVAWGAYTEASVGIRSLERAREVRQLQLQLQLQPPAAPPAVEPPPPEAPPAPAPPPIAAPPRLSLRAAQLAIQALKR